MKWLSMKTNNLRSLLGQLCGMAFLVNPSLDVLKDDYNKLIDHNFKETLSTNVTGDSYFKTPVEVDSFFLSTKAFKKQNEKAYFEKYRALVLSASSIFQLPFSFQSCLIFKESRFDKRAVSYVGAMGVAQFTQETYHFLSRALRIGQKRLTSDGDKILESDVFTFLEDEDEGGSYSSYNVQVFSDMYKMWQRYLIQNNLNDVKLVKSQFRKVLHDPEYSIGLSSMYLYYLKHKVKYRLHKQVSDKELEDPDFILSIAGAYNQGARRVLKKVKENPKNPRFKDWISYQSKVSETKGYISSIRTCMKKSTPIADDTVSGSQAIQMLEKSD